MNLGNNLLKLRKQMYLSQEKVGETVGVTRKTISNRKLEQTTSDMHQLDELAKA